MSRQGGDMRSSVGVDVGGTFTDLVAREGSGRLRACKVPTTPANLARGVLNGLAAVRHAAGVPASVAHGTTVVTNAIVERRGARVGLVTTRGFRDVLEIARQSRLHLYDLRLPPKPEPLVERRLRLEVGERVGPDGAVLLPLALNELPAIVEALERGHVESVAVCLLHSYANPAHERALKAALAPHFAHLSVSSEINAEFREYERSSTTVLNAAVMPLASHYLDELVTALGREARGVVLHLLHSAGGMMSAEAARERPLAMAASGPAAGVAAGAHLARSLGPACYGLGGTEPTVTDANLVLGYLDPGRAYGGSIRLDPGRAAAAVEGLGRRFGLSLVEAAQGMVEVANANMLRALRLVSVQRGYDLRDFALIAYGGAGPVHAGLLARQAGITRVIVPVHSGTFSALGCLVSPLRYDAVQTWRARLDVWDPKPAQDRLPELDERCLRPLLDEGIAAGEVALVRSADLRYTGQNYELEVPWRSDSDALRQAFEARHRQLYGYATGESVECVNLRVVARVRNTGVEPPEFGPVGDGESAGAQRAWFPETGEVRLPLYHRATLAAERPVLGPALIEDEWSTTLVYPGQRCAADRFGNLVIETDL